MVIGLRPLFSSSSPGAATISPGIMAVPSADGSVDGDELGAVGEGRLDLYFLDHVGNALHDLLAAQHLGASLHEVGHRAAVTRAFDDVVGDQRDRLGMVELDAALEA